MIRKIRRRFIATSMLAVSLVLVSILAVIDIANYSDVRDTIITRMELLVASQTESEFETGADEPLHEGDLNHKWDEPPAAEADTQPIEGNPSKDRIFREARFDARYFSVVCDNNGEIISIDTAQTASVTYDLAAELFDRVYGSRGGFVDQFYYMAMETAWDATPLPNGQLRYIFLDSSRELATFHSFLYSSIVVGLIGLALVFALTVIFSNIVLRPVAESYNKQKRFITDASHEIKTPLGIIAANAEVIELENGESEWTKSIRHQIDRLTALTEKLIFLSRMDEGTTQFVKRDFDLSKMVSDTAEAYEPVAKSRGREYDICVESGIRINGDEDNLRQAVSLLLDNAMKYASVEGRVSLKLNTQKRGKRHIGLSIINSVDEIEIGNHDEMFERFYRADESRSSAGSSHGIGLAVVRAIIEAHGGEVRAYSEDGKSITFIIYL